MRTLTILFSLFVTFAAVACTNDDNCTQTNGCTDPSPDAGTTPDSSTGGGGSCGDGVCKTEHGEDSANCSQDCSGVCLNDPAHPVYCEGDSIECNVVGTDCNLPVPPNVCHSGRERCPSADVAWNCCDSGPNDPDIFWCPIGTPYWCPNSRSCVGKRSDCAYGTGNACYFPMFSCRI